MIRNALKCLIFAVLSVAVLTACAKQPTQEMSDVKALIDSAVQAGGEKYAKDEMARIQERYADALAEIKAQDAKFFKSYDKAKSMLTALKADAADLQNIISARKEEAKKNAVKELDAAKEAVKDARALLAKAPKTKAMKNEVDGLNSELKSLDGSLSKVQESIDKGDYLAAAEIAKAVTSNASTISDKLEKMSRKPQPRATTKKK